MNQALAVAITAALHRMRHATCQDHPTEVAPACNGNFLGVAKPSDNTDWTDLQL